MFIKHIGKRDIADTTFSNQPSAQSDLPQEMSSLHIKNETRKLRSCPKRHVQNAQRLVLTYASPEVTVVEKYRYSDQFLIGNGAFSSVFIAIKDEHVDSRSGKIDCRAYALKRIEKAKVKPQEIKREIRTLLEISGECKNIIKCHEAVEDHFFQYLCLEVMDGDLHEFVSNKNFSKFIKEDPSINGGICEGIIDGLAYLHKNKFIHRDLKPENILFTAAPRLHFKITDFGLTKNLSTFSTMTSTRGSGVAMAPGSRCWMAPELVLGLVLHYLLTLGKHPFATINEEQPHTIERKIVDMEISLDQALRPEATFFLQNLLTKDPSKRPPAMQHKEHPFLWSNVKKITFLKAVGDQPKAERPSKHDKSDLEKGLLETKTGREIKRVSWNHTFKELYNEITNLRREKKYRTDNMIDLLRFIRNAYSHKQERSSQARKYLDENKFLWDFPLLVLDVFNVVQQLKFDEDENRSNIREALNLDT